MTDHFAEFYNADGSRKVYTEAEVEALLKQPAQDQFPAHWEMFDSPEVKRIRPEGA